MDEDELAEFVDRTMKSKSAECVTLPDELKNVVQTLRRTLTLVTPASTFKDDLKERLLSYSPERQRAVPVSGFASHSREIVVGAAVISLAGAALLLWRSRTAAVEPPIASQAS